MSLANENSSTLYWVLPTHYFKAIWLHLNLLGTWQELLNRPQLGNIWDLGHSLWPRSFTVRDWILAPQNDRILNWGRDWNRTKSGIRLFLEPQNWTTRESTADHVFRAGLPQGWSCLDLRIHVSYCPTRTEMCDDKLHRLNVLEMCKSSHVYLEYCLDQSIVFEEHRSKSFGAHLSHYYTFQNFTHSLYMAWLTHFQHV